MHLFEYLDEMDYYISENETKLGVINFYRLKLMILGTLMSSAFFFSLDYILNRSFKLHYFHVVFPLALFFMNRLIRLLEKKKHFSFSFSRILAIFSFSALFLLAGMLDLFTREEKTLLFLPLVIISSVVFFVDYFKIIICSRLIMAVLLCILDKIFREASLCMEDFILISASVAISLLCYFVLLSLQTDTGRMSRELHRKSSTDLLTGLLNKISFEETVRNYLENSEKGAACSLLIFDFDNFKHINDTYGHQTGDDVLKFFGYTLKRSFRDSDILGRIGGDEFMVCVTTPVSDEFFKKRCDSILYELRSAKVGDAGGFSSSIGIAQDMNGTADFELLYSTADQALYQAKQNGKGCFVKKEVPQKN